MNGKEFLKAVDMLEKEKHIDRNYIFESMEQSLANAYKKHSGGKQNVEVKIDKETGEIVWKTKLNNYLWSSPVDFYDKDGNGYIIQCDSAGNMFLIDGNTGEILNTITLDANIEASPAIYEDMIVVATRAGSIYGIEIE